MSKTYTKAQIKNYGRVCFMAGAALGILIGGALKI